MSSSAIASAVQRCAAKAAPEPTYGPGQLAGAEIDRRMERAFR